MGNSAAAVTAAVTAAAAAAPQGVGPGPGPWGHAHWAQGPMPIGPKGPCPLGLGPAQVRGPCPLGLGPARSRPMASGVGRGIKMNITKSSWCY